MSKQTLPGHILQGDCNLGCFKLFGVKFLAKNSLWEISGVKFWWWEMLGVKFSIGKFLWENVQWEISGGEFLVGLHSL